MTLEVKQITAITEDNIEVLLTDDIPFAIDRKEFEAFIAPNGHFEWVMGEDEYSCSIHEYWDDAIGATPQAQHLNQFAGQSEAVQMAFGVILSKEIKEAKND